MKKIVAIFMFITCVFCLSACYYSTERLKNKMIQYYSEDANYCNVAGKVCSMEYLETIDEMRIGLTNLKADGEFKIINSSAVQIFTIVCWSERYINLEIGDDISIVSAAMVFYNGHKYPIIQLARGNNELFSFVEGKMVYINWIKETNQI